MPRSVQAAIGLACVLGLLGVASAALWIADATAGGAGTRWLSAALHVQGDATRAASPLYLLAFAVVPIALRRNAGQARIAFRLALLASITLTVMEFGLAGTALQARRVDAGLAGMLVVLALIALLALSLSRPSAREWFGAAGRD